MSLSNNQNNYINQQVAEIQTNEQFINETNYGLDINGNDLKPIVDAIIEGTIITNSLWEPHYVEFSYFEIADILRNGWGQTSINTTTAFRQELIKKLSYDLIIQFLRLEINNKHHFNAEERDRVNIIFNILRNYVDL